MADTTDIPSASAAALVSPSRSERRSGHVGAKLRAAREAADLSLEDVAQKTRIRESHLTALESLDMTALPGRAYAIGFLRAYAEFLDLDADDCIKRFKVETAARSAAAPEARYEFPQAATGRASFAPGSSIVLIAVVLFLGVWGGWQLTRPSIDDLYFSDADLYGGPAEPDPGPALGGEPIPALDARDAPVRPVQGDAAEDGAFADLDNRPIRSDVLLAVGRGEAVAESAALDDEPPVADAAPAAASSPRAPNMPSELTPGAASDAPSEAAPAVDAAEPSLAEAAARARAREEDEIARAIAAGLAALEAERLEAERAAREAEASAAAASAPDLVAPASDPGGEPAPDAPVTRPPETPDAPAPEASAAPPAEAPILAQPAASAAEASASPAPRADAAPSAAPSGVVSAEPAALAAAIGDGPEPGDPAAASPETAADSVAASPPAPAAVLQAPAAAPEAAPRRPAPALPAGEVLGSATANARVVVRAVIPGYLRVIDDSGVVLVNKQLTTGDLFYAPANRRATLTVYNAAGFDVIVDGDYKGRLGQPGEGKADLSLDPEYLRELLP